MEVSPNRNLLLTVVASHGAELRRFFASRLPDSSEVPDLVQEVYLRILKVEQPERIRCPRAYVYRTAANLAREHWFARSGRPPHIALEEVSEEALSAEIDAFAPTAPERAVATAEAIGQLVRLLAQVPPKMRASVLWAHRDGYSYEEISARLAVSTSMVKKYLTKALAHCRNSPSFSPI